MRGELVAKLALDDESVLDGQYGVVTRPSKVEADGTAVVGGDCDLHEWKLL
jgi:hypothetical protein